MNAARVLIVLLLVWSMQAVPVAACGTCYGDPTSPQTQGLNMAIFTLLGFIGTVLCFVLTVSIVLVRRAQRFHCENPVAAAYMPGGGS